MPSAPRLLAVLAALLTGCVSDAPERPAEEVAGTPDAVPRDAPRSRYGNPDSYEALGRTYHVMDSAEGFTQKGLASWYGKKFHGRRTSSGTPYNMYAMTAAHRELPLPTWVEVTNLDNGRQAVVKVNDRGPFVDPEERIIDLSYAAADRLGITVRGTAPVRLRVVETSTPSAAEGQPAAAPSSSAAQAGTAAAAPGPEAVEPLPLYLQAGAFSQRDNAERVRSQARGLGAPVSIEPFEREAETLHRVRLGPLEDLAEADRLRERLRALGIESFLVAP
ncbi:septal ring lytic transglycosylase RlpA family protein [Halorhodospira neutriphila]|uniref:Endolytic peptidoglycan transglycosylase RlpA n=1 Tax=Halorhodospira neutriphila TaxID=168379 RepID=A0ABS1E4K6_9GAMM|nr:septal ring lytic transglycosylase RlpA family protein [Halorhodospira neutriphila]MBK1726139.1 hypothetical protein [Halorhodospira neutriphila]